MIDNNAAPAAIDDARATAPADNAEAEMLARFAEDDGLIDETGESQPNEAPAKGKKPSGDEASRSEQSEDEDALFADKDEDATEDAEQDKDEPKAIEIDGEEVPLATVKEWRDAGLRQADYTRKSQALAEERRGIETERARVKQHETDVSTALEMAQAIIKAYAPQEPDLNLAISDPVEYTRQRAIYESSMSHLNQIVARHADLTEKAYQQAAQETSAQRTKRLQAEDQALLSHFPQLADPKKVAPFFRNLDATLAAYGFLEGSIKQVEDHKMVLVLADAARWRDLQARKAQQTTQAAKPNTVASAPAKPRANKVGPSFDDQMRRAQSPRQREEILAQRFND